jgi:hypothetical protein
MMNRQMVKTAIAASSLALAVGGLTVGGSTTAQAALSIVQAVPTRDCSEVPQQTALAAGAGAAGGAAIGGPVGGAIGAGIGVIGSWIGGCTQTISGTPLPVDGPS